MARSGSLLSTATIIEPQKIVLVGHSLGSCISNALVAAIPNLVDGAVLTGWSFNSTPSNPFGQSIATIQPKIANAVSPRWESYDSGALTFNNFDSYVLV